MSDARITFFSERLGRTASVLLVVPREPPPQFLRARPESDERAVLYLLHGLGDDHTAWIRNTRIVQYARERGVAVALPAVRRSFYRDMASGLSYWQFVSEEVPRQVQRFLGVSGIPERTFIAGNSMGGYGALMHAFAHPNRYAAVASFSGAVDIDNRFNVALRADPRTRSRVSIERKLIFGTERSLQTTEHDLFWRVSHLTDTHHRIPELFLTCGRNDYLLADNERFAVHLAACGIRHTYRTVPGGHDWPVWDRNVQDFLQFLEVRGLLL